MFSFLISSKKIIKKFIKLIISLLFFLIVFLFHSKKKSIKDSKKRILIVKLDAIGDYILFRNFLEIIKTDNKYSDYEITFLGNSVNKKIAEILDVKFINEFIWLKKKNILLKPFYFLRILNDLKYSFDLILYPCYSREFVADLFIKYSKADRKIGFKGDTNCISLFIKNISDKWYSKLIEIDKNIIFEFYKNREFFNQVLQTNLDILKPEIKTENLVIDKKIDLPEKYVVLFPGAQEKKRRWPKNNFIDIANFLVERYKLKVFVCGVKDDSLLYENDNIIDLAGKTTLIELMYIMSKAILVISNDTSGAHIGIAVNTPTIILSQFNHYKRFVPYPSEIKNIYCLTPEIYIKNQDELIEKFKHGSGVDISLIRVDEVKNMINFILNNGI